MSLTSYGTSNLCEEYSTQYCKYSDKTEYLEKKILRKRATEDTLPFQIGISLIIFVFKSRGGLEEAIVF